MLAVLSYVSPHHAHVQCPSCFRMRHRMISILVDAAAALTVFSELQTVLYGGNRYCDSGLQLRSLAG